jgi:photosystem I P700 chlorophyll a apoprotein A1
MARKLFASNLAHLSLVFFWIAGMHFDGAYFSNYSAYLKDPKHCFPSAHLVWSLVGQDILNSDVGGYFQGIYITSGIFQLWRSEGIITQVHLKYASAASLAGTILALSGSYLHIHISSLIQPAHIGGFYKKFKSLSYHHLSLLFGLGSISWCGHQIHISLPLNRLLDSGIAPAVIPSPQDLLSRELIEVILPGFGVRPLLDINQNYSSILGGTGKLLNPSTGSICLSQVAAHHFYVGVVLITAVVIVLISKIYQAVAWRAIQFQVNWHAQLSINLAVTASLSITFAHHIYAMPVYPYCASDYPTVLCLFCHHMWIGGFLTVGAAAHASIFMVADIRMSLKSWPCKLLNH